MHDVMQPIRDPGWVLTHEGYNVLTENAVESRFALGNGFLGLSDWSLADRGMERRFALRQPATDAERLEA